MFEVVYFLRKVQALTVSNSRILRIKNAKCSEFSYEPEHTVKFSNLH